MNKTEYTYYINHSKILRRASGQRLEIWGLTGTDDFIEVMSWQRIGGRAYTMGRSYYGWKAGMKKVSWDEVVIELL